MPLPDKNILDAFRDAVLRAAASWDSSVGSGWEQTNPKKDTIYFYETPDSQVIIGKRGGFEYKFNSRDWMRAQLNEEKRLRVKGLSPEQIYNLAKIESQYIDFEQV